MKTYPTRISASSRATRPRERGVVLVFALIALLILMVGSVALVRSFNSSLINTGSIAFKKDLVNRNEAVVAQVLAQVRASTGGLTDETVAGNDQRSLNYSARMLEYNAQGIPNLLLVSNGAFDTNPFTSISNDIETEDGVKLRYVIDRQCNGPGTASDLGAAGCITDPAGASRLLRGSSDSPIRAENAAGGRRGALTVDPVYRLTIRATGPKGTLAFYQTTFTL